MGHEEGSEGYGGVHGYILVSLRQSLCVCYFVGCNCYDFTMTVKSVSCEEKA